MSKHTDGVPGLDLILDDPAIFLHSIDVDTDRVSFIRTTSTMLREASFVDGRIPISTTPPEWTRLSEVIAATRPTSGLDRLLLNCSFCGSTLLARLLDVPGRSLVLKEPRCLTDIAAWKGFQARDRLPADRLGPILKLARSALRRRFSPEEVVTVKVASQGNVLLDALTKNAGLLRPVFITISRLQFLRAIFRGGPERMHYAATIAWHMAAEELDGDALLREAVAAGADPLRKAANLAVLARYLQVRLFQRAALAGGWNDDNVIDYDTITQSPREATAKATRALCVQIDEDDIERNVAYLADHYSKQPNEPFSSERQRLADRQVHIDHRQVFDDALAWAETALGPQLKVIE